MLDGASATLAANSNGCLCSGSGTANMWCGTTCSAVAAAAEYSLRILLTLLRRDKQAHFARADSF